METLKLVGLDLQSLHQAEFGQFITRFFEDFDKTSLSTDTDTDFKTLFDSLKALVPTYNKALEQIRANEESKKIAELDKIRDSDVQALKDSIKPYRNSRDTAQKDAYNALKIVLDMYKNVSKEGYEKGTKQISTLVSTLQSDKYSSHLRVLKIENFVRILNESNTAFNELFAHRSFQILQKDPHTAKDIRKEMTAIYKKMSNYILTLADVKQEEFYKKVLEVINNSRKYYADVLAIRVGRKGKEEKITTEK